MPQKPPAFQFYAKDFLASDTVALMPRQDIGLYILLLCAAWNSDQPGCLPEPIELTAKICRTYAKDVRKFLARYPTTFRKDQDIFRERYANVRLCEQAISYSVISEKRRDAAKIKHANAEQMHPSASASASATATKTKDKPPQPPLELPDWIPVQPWQDYLAMRKKIRKPMTPRAISLAFQKLRELSDLGHEPLHVLNQSILNSWQGLFEIKRGGNGNGQSNSRFSLTQEEREQREKRLAEYREEHQPHTKFVRLE